MLDDFSDSLLILEMLEQLSSVSEIFYAHVFGVKNFFSISIFSNFLKWRNFKGSFLSCAGGGSVGNIDHLVVTKKTLSTSGYS